MNISHETNSNFYTGKERYNLLDEKLNLCHFMLLKQKDGTLDIDLSSAGLTDDILREVSQIYVFANDSERYVADASKYILEELVGITVCANVVSDVLDCELPSFKARDLVIVIDRVPESEIGQSVFRKAREAEANILLVSDNVSEGSVTGNVDKALHIIVDTKLDEATILAYSTILIAFYALALKMAKTRGRLDDTEYQRILAEFSSLPDKAQRVLRDKERIRWLAEKRADESGIYFIGNEGMDHVVATEGCRIIKGLGGVVYSEAYIADDLNEREIDSIKKGSLLLFVLTQDFSNDKVVDIMNRCKDKGACLMVLTTFGNFDMEDIADFTVYIPKTEDYFSALLAVIPLRFLGYYIGVLNR